jgi:hypothetical protein
MAQMVERRVNRPTRLPGRENIELQIPTGWICFLIERRRLLLGLGPLYSRTVLYQTLKIIMTEILLMYLRYLNWFWRMRVWPSKGSIFQHCKIFSLNLNVTINYKYSSRVLSVVCCMFFNFHIVIFVKTYPRSEILKILLFILESKSKSISKYCCIHQRHNVDRTYLRCCPAIAWNRLRCLEGVREGCWLCSVTFTDFH